MRKKLRAARKISGFLKIIIAAVLFSCTQLLAAEDSLKLTPESLYKSAVENNISLIQLGIEKMQSEAELKKAKAARFPTVDFQTTMTYMTNPMIEPITLTAGELGSYTMGGSDILLPAEDMVIYKGSENTHYNFQFTVDQPVFTWGKIKNMELLYSSINETSGLQLQKKQHEIRTSLYVYSYVLYYISMIEDTLKMQKSVSERMIEIADESYKNGFILYADLLDARIKASEISVAEAQLLQQREQTLLQLARLSGIKDISARDFDFDFISEISSLEVPGLDECMNSSLSNNPDIQLLTKVQRINELKLDITRAATGFKPDIGLHFELSYSGSRFPFIETDWFGQDSLGLTSTIAVSGNVFDGGSALADAEKDSYELEKAMYDYEDGVDSIRQYISETLLKLELNRRNIEYHRLKQENDNLQIGIKQTQFTAGSGDETDLLEEELNLYTDRISEYRESIDFYTNYYSLYGAYALPEF